MSRLFEKFEVNRAPRWPLMSRLVALSVVLHGLFFVAVVYVPTLRSLLFVASSVSGIKFVNEDYDPTLIGQRATIVKLEPHEKLYYPPDYFGAPEVAQTTQFDPMFVQPAMPPPMPPPPPVYRQRRQRAPEPTPTPDEVAQATPTPSPEAAPASEEQKQAEAELDRVAQQAGVKRPPQPNVRPFEDIAREGKQLFDEGKLNLNSAIEVTAVAPLNADGTFGEPKYDWVTSSDENTALLAQKLVMALSQSKIFAILEGAKQVNLALKLDQQNISVRVAGELPSDADATKYATGYGVLLTVARNGKKGTKEGELYNNLKVDSQGKEFVMTFEMPKEAAGRMISEMLAKKAGAPAPAPSGTPGSKT